MPLPDLLPSPLNPLVGPLLRWSSRVWGALASLLSSRQRAKPLTRIRWFFRDARTHVQAERMLRESGLAGDRATIQGVVSNVKSEWRLHTVDVLLLGRSGTCYPFRCLFNVKKLPESVSNPGSKAVWVEIAGRVTGECAEYRTVPGSKGFPIILDRCTLVNIGSNWTDDFFSPERKITVG